MRFLIVFLLLLSTLFGYQKGDKISPNVQEKLNIKEEKIYIIDFFASWCPSCEKEMPYISKVNDIIDKEKIEIIGVGVDEDVKKGEEFVRKVKVSFRVVNDPKSEIIKEFDPIGMPAVYIIKENKIVDSIIGAKDDVDKILLEKLEALK
jgi:thiol-disulfide isomerase/thioredoxin